MNLKKISLIIFFILLIGFVFFGLNSLSNKDKVLYKYLYEDLFINENYNVMYGSSTIEYMDTKLLKACGEWLNRGIGNSEIMDNNRYIRFSQKRIKPQNILIYMGENDLSRDSSLAETWHRFIFFINTVQDRYPDAKIHILGIKMSPARTHAWDDFHAFNGKARSVAANDDDMFYFELPQYNDFFANDEIHLNPAGYDFIGSEVIRNC